MRLRFIALRPSITRDVMTGINISACTSTKTCNVSMCISTFYSPPPSYSTRCRDWYQYVHVHVYKICTIYLCAYLHSTALRPLIHYMRIYDWYFRVVWSHSSVRHISMCTSTINIRPFITRDFMTGIVLLRVRLPYYQFSQSRAQH